MGSRNSLTAAALAGFAAVGIGLAVAPGAAAEQPNVAGVITPDEAREIAASGAGTCATLARSAATAPLTPEDVSLVIDSYLGSGWDAESTSDILTESVDRGCGQFLPQVSRALTSYNPG